MTVLKYPNYKNTDFASFHRVRQLKRKYNLKALNIKDKELFLTRNKPPSGPWGPQSNMLKDVTREVRGDTGQMTWDT